MMWAFTVDSFFSRLFQMHMCFITEIFLIGFLVGKSCKALFNVYVIYFYDMKR